MKPATILATTVLAASPLWLACSASAVPIGMGLALKDSPSSDIVTVRAVVAGRAGAAGRVGGVVGGGRYVGAGRWADSGWAGAPVGWRPGYGLAAGALVGGAIAASQPGYGYGYDNGPDPGYYGYGAGYPASYNTSPDIHGYGGYAFGPTPYDAYIPTCSYVGGPKYGDWACR
jgi:hypothetical protein